jgi:hypothetical protein
VPYMDQTNNQDLTDAATTRHDAVQSEMEAFIREHPYTETEVERLRNEWNAILQPEMLAGAAGEDIRRFLQSPKGGSPGNQQTFNRTWNELGDEEASNRVKTAINYLLYGPEELSLERRLNDLLNGEVPEAFPGLKEGLLTKVLAMAFLDRFLPILYLNHRRALLADLWGVHLPAEGPRNSKGELIVRSNDAILERLTPKFGSLEHAAGFLWPKIAGSLERTGGGKGSRTTTSAPDRRSFTCTNCHLVKPLVQLKDAENFLCNDCM